MKKRKERKILSLFLAIVLSLSMTVTSFAAGSTDGTESTDTEVLELLGDQASETEWTAEDFVYTEMSQTMNGCDYQRTIVISGQAVAGFSESGVEKIQTNKNLVIPSKTPDGETIIGVADGAFKEQGIESLTLPEGMMVDYDDTLTHTVTRRGNFLIGASAFYKNKLTSLVLPEGVIMIGSSAFARNELESVSIPHTFWWLENSAFAYNNLTTVGFPRTCDFQAQIHAFAFAHNNIKSVRLPDYMEVVEKKVFYWNPGMEDCPADAPEEQKEWGGVVYMYTNNEALFDMERIHHIERTAESQKSWHQKLVLGEDPGAGTSWNADDFTFEGTKVTGLSESGIEKRKENRELVIPSATPSGEEVTELGDTTNTYGLFGAEGEVFDSVELPDTLVRIGDRAFMGNNLTSIAFPNGLKEIGLAAFQTNQLAAIILPDTLTTLGGGAFATNPTLSNIHISRSMTEIPAGAFGCSDGKNWMENLTEITIPEGITKIGNNAFAGNNFTSITIPSTVKEIGSYAFSTKNYLMKDTATTLTLPEGLEKIGNRAFRNKAIEEVVLPSTVTKLYAQTFEKEFSDDAETVVTKVILRSKEQYEDAKNFPASTYHKLVLRVEGEWNPEDFTYGEISAELYPATDSSAKVLISGIGVTGFSESGTQKLENNKDLVIPAKDTDGNPVIGVGASAFKNQGIESLTLPEGVMADYEGAYIAEGLTQRGNFIIQRQAFYGNKLTSLTLPEGVILVDMQAFASNQLQEVTLPHTIWWISTGGFYKNQITELVFPQTCDFKLNMDPQAFGSNLIKSVRLPDRTEKLPNSVFLQCTGMEPVTDEGATAAQKKGGIVYMYTDNEELFNENLVTHLDREGDGTKPTGTKSYVQKLILGAMPEELQPWNAVHFTFDGTTIIGFSDSGKLKLQENKHVVLPETTPEGEAVTAIGASAFAGTGAAVTDMETVSIPKTVETIGNMAFNWTNLIEVELPDSVTTLGVSAFGNSAQLAKVKLSGNLKTIPQACFTSSSVKEVVIPEGVETIGRGAFQGAQITSLSLPSTLVTIDRDAFGNHQLTELVIPDSVETIGRSAFAIVQEGLESTLAKVTFGANLKTIDNTAFRNCAISEAEIPAGLTTLHKDAFKECTNGKVKLYTSNKEHLNSTTGIVSEGTNHTVIYNQIVGTGWSMTDFTYDGTTVTGWSEKGNQTRLANHNLVIPTINPAGEEITAIGDAAFKIPDGEWIQGKDSVESPNGMETVVFPDTLETIGAEAFRYNSLQTVEFPESVTTIGGSAFNSNQLTKLVLPDTITTVGAGAFATNAITELTLSKGMTKLEQGIFSMNINLTSVEIPDTITEIGDMAFAGARLETLTIPESVTKIGRKAFHLHHLTELTIPGNVKEIGDSAFEGTFKAITLRKLVLEEGVETIGAYAFKEGYLESVQLPASLKTLGTDPFINNAGTDNDYVVVLHTSNPEHLKLAASDYHKIVIDSDKSGLKAAIEGAKAYEASKYTEESYGKLQAAIEKAEIVLNNETALQSEVDTEKEALEKAVKELELRPELASIRITPPAKVVYQVGDEIDLIGLQVIAVYSDGTEVPVTDYEVSGYDGAKEGKQTVTVSYGGKTAAFEVTVNKKADPDPVDPDPVDPDPVDPDPVDPTPTEPVHKFIDVNEGDWYYDTVNSVYERGLMTGLTDTVFGPADNLVRAQFATIVYRLEGCPEVDYKDAFPDVPENAWFMKAVIWANEAGVVTGYTDSGLFGPADNITREQMAVMMYRYVNKKGYDLGEKADFSSYPDAGSVSEFAYEAMRWCVGNRIITGDNGMLNPQGYANRAECATIVSRFLKLYDK